MIIDLRSDTVTKPSKGMLDAMMSAQVGDDVFREDPTVNALEERLAKMFGKQKALFFPSGSMANQVAIKLHTNPGEQVVCDKYAHIYNYEVGGVAFHSGASCKLIDGNRGMFTAEQVKEAINPSDYYYSQTSLVEVENTTNKKVYTILQLRLHPSIIALKQKVLNGPKDKVYDVDLTYLTSRGHWYYTSWKGDTSKSGGIASNIGVHFYDMLSWIFGGVKQNIVHLHSHDRASGYLEFEKARVRWFLSIDYDVIPNEIKETGQRTYRSITVDGEEIEFSGGFTELHTKSYEDILAGNGFGLSDARQSIEIVQEIRNSEISPMKDDYHPFAKSAKSKHPFNGGHH